MKKLLSILAFAILFLAPSSQSQQIYLGPQVGSVRPQVYGVLPQIYGGTGTSVPTPSCYGIGHALQWNPTGTPQYQCYSFALTGGTVTQVSPTGTNNMFTLNVANQTTTPQISIALSNAINQIFIGTGSGTGSWGTLPNCVGSMVALNYNNSTQAVSCQSISGVIANALTANTSGGASPGVSFNGTSPVTIDFHTVGAPSVTGSGASGTWGIDITGQAGSVVGNLTFNSSGSGGSSPQVYNGSTTFVVSYNTIGAPSTTGTGASGSWSINAATATALATLPSACTPTTQFAYGIGTNGNALCQSFTVGGNIVAQVNFTSCTLGDDGGEGSGCEATQSWGTTISGSYSWWCSIGAYSSGTLSETGRFTVNQYAPNSSTSFTYVLDNMQSGSRGSTLPMSCWAAQ